MNIKYIISIFVLCCHNYREIRKWRRVVKLATDTSAIRHHLLEEETLKNQVTLIKLNFWLMTKMAKIMREWCKVDARFVASFLGGDRINFSYLRNIAQNFDMP